MILKEIDERRALRGLSETMIPVEVLQRILKAAALAPSCSNKQPWRFLVMNKEETLSVVKNHLSGGNYWAKKSPAVIAVITRDDLDCRLDGKRDYAYFDTGMASMNLQLQAQKEGLVSHPIAGFDAVGLRQALQISEDYTLLTLIVLGYPGNAEELNEKHKEMEEAPRTRRPVEDMVYFNQWKDLNPR